MKVKVIFLFIVVMSSCSNKSSTQKLIPEEYYFPAEKIAFGKTFVYVNRNSGDTSYIDLFNEKTILVQRSYDKNSVSDSIIFLDRKPVDHYINALNKGELWKANQISDTVVKDNEGKLNEISAFHWNKDSLYTIVRSRNQIVKDTTIQWNGKSYPSIITNTIIETNSNFLQTPEGNHVFKMEAINYICKDIGSVKRLLLCSWNANPIVSDLIEIKNMQPR